MIRRWFGLEQTPVANPKRAYSPRLTVSRSTILSVRFTPEQVQVLERVAAEQNITTSELIRRSVSLHLFDFPDGHRRRAKKRRRLTTGD